MGYSKLVYDSVGRSYPRKNQYIVDLLKASPSEKKSIDKKSHPYIKELEDFKNKEKDFLERIEKEAKEKFSNIENKKIRDLEETYYKAVKKESFYKDYVDLTYDAELEHLIAEREVMHIPGIISHDKDLHEQLKERSAQLANISQSEIDQANKEIEAKTKLRKEQLDAELKDLDEKFRKKIISKTALKTEKKSKKRAADDDIKSYSYLNKKTSYEEDIKNIKHRIKIDFKSGMNVLESDKSDIRRKTPIEVDKTKPLISYATALIPGLGQLLNKQYMKAIFFFIGTLFIYLVSIPYALGYGNYQGEGIQGLISLAQGGARLDRSVIFLIEGIIAIMLLVIAFIIFYVSFKDVNTVEKGLIKGIRKKEWFETKQSIATDGFPYLVISPAAIVTMFIVLVPIITTVFLSFTNYDPNHQSKFEWIGLGNYATLFRGEGVAGMAFWPIVLWTLIWTFGATTLAIAIGFILSLIANQERIKFKGFFRTIYLLPWAVPAFITIMFFSQMFASNGPLTGLIKSVFGDTLFGMPIDIKNNTIQTRVILMLLQGWLGSAYIFLLTTGILQSIPKDLYEAAEIDGATGFQQTLKITIPLVLYQTGPLLIGQYTFNFNNFSIIHLFNGGGPFLPSTYGNVAGSTDILISYIYKLTIGNNYQALGAAVTMIVSLTLMFVTFLGMRDMKAFKED